jgi:hypothetical protein
VIYHPAAAISILDRVESRVANSSPTILSLVRAWSTLGDGPRASRVARKAQSYRIRALIQVGQDLGFADVLDEILHEITAIVDPDEKDRHLSALALALSERRLMEDARRVTRMIQSPIVRIENVLNPQEALALLPHILDADDREAMEDRVAQALAAIGRKEDALQLLAAAADTFRHCWRNLRVAEGFAEGGYLDAALKHTLEVAEELRGGLSGGMADSIYGDACVLFARLGEFGRAGDLAAAANMGRRYVAFKITEVCKMLVGSGLEEQALGLAWSIPEMADATPAFITIAERRARSGEVDAAVALLEKTAAALLEVLEREALREKYISNRESLEHRSATALNEVARGYFRIGKIERAVELATRTLPEGSDRNLFSLNAGDSRDLAMDALRADHAQAATVLLDYAFECAKAVDLNLPYERAERLARLVVPNAVVGREEIAAQVWVVTERSSFDSVSLLNGCILIATDCGALDAQIPDTLVDAICDWVERA